MSSCSFVYSFLITLLVSVYASPPEIASLDATLTVEKDESYSLACRLLRGTKPVNFEWFKNGLKINQKNDNIFVESKPSISNLNFEPIHDHDSANYSCRATNNHGEDVKWTFLQVKGLQFYNFLLLGVSILDQCVSLLFLNLYAILFRLSFLELFETFSQVQICVNFEILPIFSKCFFIFPCFYLF